MQRKCHISVWALICMFVFYGCNAKALRKEINTEREKIHKLIHIGMDIDEASKILRENGYKVGAKFMPTKNKDYYVVNIPLIDKIPWIATFAETTDTETDFDPYVMLTAGLDNKITSIE